MYIFVCVFVLSFCVVFFCVCVCFMCFFYEQATCNENIFRASINMQRAL